VLTSAHEPTTRAARAPRSTIVAPEPAGAPAAPHVRARPPDDPLARTLARSVAQRGARLPPDLQAGVEALSGIDLSAVRVHYDAAQPARIGARAFARGSEIHVGPGQDRHLPHEAWHVVQQLQRRVRPTRRIGAVAVNDDRALEHEAEQMGERAARIGAAGGVRAPVRVGDPPGDGAPVVQGVFDAITNALHHRRKLGAEITEATRGAAPDDNRLYKAVPNGTWGGLSAPAKALRLKHTVALRNAAGAAFTWRVAEYSDVRTCFDLEASKSHWMSWGDVRFTEDHAEIEWIVRHPAEPQGVTYYRDRLAEVSSSRTALRRAVARLPGANAYVFSRSMNPADGDAFLIKTGATDGASAQITFESTDAAVTKRALLEGLSHGLSVVPRVTLRDADPAVAATVQTAAARVPVAHVDMELIMAYIVGDLCHKIATLEEGTGWDNVAANFKDWRMLFPKSHPWQVFLQACSVPVVGPDAQVRVALNGQQAALINDVLELFAGKLVGRNTATRWAGERWGPAPAPPHARVLLDPGDFTAVSDPGGVLSNLLITGDAPAGGIATITAALTTFIDTNMPGGLNLEFTNVVDALLDPTKAHQAVVRSSGFATHAAPAIGVRPDKGFAFEDRAEVQTQFPGLATTYARIVALVDRY
jgi:hypothetical protein